MFPLAPLFPHQKQGGEKLMKKPYIKPEITIYATDSPEHYKIMVLLESERTASETETSDTVK